MLDVSSLELNLRQALTIIQHAPHHLATMMWGQPGIGKTKALYDIFSKLDYHVITVLAGCSEPTDLAGIPFAYKDKYAKFLVPWWGYAISEDCLKDNEAPDEWKGKTILFMDDLCTAPEQTQAAFYKFTDEGRIGDLIKRDNVKLVAASNRLDDKSAVTDMPLALGNRFMHLYVKPDAKVWVEWAVRAGIHPTIVGFLRKAPIHLTNFDDAVNKSEEKAFATPRTWHYLSDALFALEGVTSDDLDYTYRVAAGLVGHGIAMEYTEWVSHTESLISPEEVLKDPKKCRLPDSVDIAHATISNLEHFFRQPEHYKHWQPFCRYSIRFTKFKELGMLLAHTLATTILEDFEPEMMREAAGSQELVDIFKVYGKFLNFANTL